MLRWRCGWGNVDDVDDGLPLVVAALLLRREGGGGGGLGLFVGLKFNGELNFQQGLNLRVANVRSI